MNDYTIARILNATEKGLLFTAIQKGVPIFNPITRLLLVGYGAFAGLLIALCLTAITINELQERKKKPTWYIAMMLGTITLEITYLFL